MPKNWCILLAAKSLRLNERRPQSRAGRRAKAAEIDAHRPRFDQARLRLVRGLSGPAVPTVQQFLSRQYLGSLGRTVPPDGSQRLYGLSGVSPRGFPDF